MLRAIIGRTALAVTLGASVAFAALAAGEGALPSPFNRGDVLQLPGLPPIPMPPGTRVYGPRGTEAQATEPKAEPKPEEPKKQPQVKRSDLDKPATRNQFLDELFGRLNKSGDEDEAKGIAGAFERVWLRSGSDTADLLMNRSMTAFQSKDYALAIEILDKLVVIDPDWAEAWNRRATAKYFADDYAGAMADIGETLKLEPRHFGALSGMGYILQRSGMERRALEVFRKTLDIYPKLDDVRKNVDKLKLDVEGRDI